MLSYSTQMIEVTVSKTRKVYLGNYNTKEILISVKQRLLPRENLQEVFHELTEFVEENLESEIQLALLPITEKQQLRKAQELAMHEE